MEVDVNVSIPDGIPEKAGHGLAFVGLVQALIETAVKLGLSKAQLIERMPKVIETAWEE